MGWLTYQNYKDTFYDPANAAYVNYITSLSKARINAKKWMVHGRATRLVDLGSAAKGLFGQCFMNLVETGDSSSLACAFAMPNNATASATYTLNLQPKRYGLLSPKSTRDLDNSGAEAMKVDSDQGNAVVVVSDLESGKELGRYPYDGVVTYSNTLLAFDVQVIKLAVE